MNSYNKMDDSKYRIIMRNDGNSKLSKPTVPHWTPGVNKKTFSNILYAVEPSNNHLNNILTKTYETIQLPTPNGTTLEVYKSNATDEVGLGGREDEWWRESTMERERSITDAASSSMIKKYK